MRFNSWVFVAFFAAVYAVYWCCRRRVRAQNALLLVASYVFYGYWDWRFLGLLALSTGVDYAVARHLPGSTAGRRRGLLIVSAVVNLGVLGLFKYFNFFAASLGELLAAAGIHADPITLRVILPVGISFYTFQTLSYTIDVYRGQLAPTRSLLDFALFVAFFPQLVAGPIERAGRLLPQIEQPRRLQAGAVEAGLWLVLLGYFKKVVVADNLALVANAVFNDPGNQQGLNIILGTLAFAGQIYGDFSGYSDIARGLCKLLGFELMVNFRLPYLARNPREFWQRWHISLSTWLRDYLYIALGGNRAGWARTCRNLMVTMLLGGLWHGASWHFVAWGGFHGVVLVGCHLWEQRYGGALRGRGPEGLRHVVGVGLTLTLVGIGWVLFRAETLTMAWQLLSHVGLRPTATSLNLGWRLILFWGPLLLVEAPSAWRGDLLFWPRARLWLRAPAYGALLAAIAVFGVRASTEFIYFQF